MSMRIRTFVTVCGLSALTLLATPAFAVDSKTYPGSLCQPRTNTPDYLIDNIGRVRNNSLNAFLTVNCPIVRDDTAANNLDGIVTAFATVVDNHPNFNVSCTLFSEQNNPNNNAVIDSATASTNGLPVGATLTFTNIASSFQGHYHLVCTLPPAFNAQFSSIKMYGVTEKN
jgi:hypothetical protein